MKLSLYRIGLVLVIVGAVMLLSGTALLALAATVLWVGP